MNQIFYSWSTLKGLKPVPVFYEINSEFDFFLASQSPMLYRIINIKCIVLFTNIKMEISLGILQISGT